MPKMSRHFLVAAIMLGSLQSAQVYGGEEPKNAPPSNLNPNAAAPVGKAAPAVSKPATAVNKPATTAVTATVPASKPAETAKAPAAQTPAATATPQQPTATNASAGMPAPGTHELRSLSVIEILISLLLLAIFLLVLLKGNIFKHQH